MARTIAYPDLALKNSTGLDANEEARDFLNIVERTIIFTRHSTSSRRFESRRI